MIKAAIEKAINEDMAEIWSLLDGDEKRLVLDNFEVHSFKKNQLIYAEPRQGFIDIILGAGHKALRVSVLDA